MQRKKLLRVAAIVSLLISPLTTALPANAAGATISGVTAYSTGQSGGELENVSLTLTSGSSTVAKTTSDANGDYSFNVATDGTFVVTADTPAGFKPKAGVSVSVSGGAATPASADIIFSPVSVAGYWTVAADGGVFAYGEAKSYGSMGGKPLNSKIVGLIGAPDNLGYTLVAADGGIFAFGSAQFYGSMGGKPLNSPIVGISPTYEGDGAGYYLVAADGGIFAFGPDAAFHGSMGGKALNSPIVGMTSDVTDYEGYHLVAADGGVFSFEAEFKGSAGALKLNKPIVGITPNLAYDEDTNLPKGGYYLVASDGGVFAYGADFHGSAGALKLNKPVVGIDIASDGTGYTMVASDGGVFSYPSTTENYGSAASLKLAAPMVGIWTI